MSQMSHESSYESVSGFSLKVRIRVRFRVYRCFLGLALVLWLRLGLDLGFTGLLGGWFGVRVGVRVRVYRCFSLRLTFDW